MMRYTLLLTLTLLLTPSSLLADEAPSELETVITSQLVAFQNNDAQTAWGHAHASIRSIFVTPDRFMSMVSRGYEPLLSFAVIEFISSELTDGVWYQLVRLEDQKGQWHNVLYALIETQPNNYQIAGVQLITSPSL